MTDLAPKFHDSLNKCTSTYETGRWHCNQKSRNKSLSVEFFYNIVNQRSTPAKIFYIGRLGAVAKHRPAGLVARPDTHCTRTQDG